MQEHPCTMRLSKCDHGPGGTPQLRTSLMAILQAAVPSAYGTFVLIESMRQARTNRCGPVVHEGHRIRRSWLQLCEAAAGPRFRSQAAKISPAQLSIFPRDRKWKQRVRVRKFVGSTAPLELNPEEFRQLGYGVIDRIAEFLTSLSSRPVLLTKPPLPFASRFHCLFRNKGRMPAGCWNMR